MKYFVFGYSKTASVSLHEAFKRLGFKSLHSGGGSGLADKHPNHFKITMDKYYNNILTDKPILHGFDEYDCYLDYPVHESLIFSHIVLEYPDAKYISLTRNLDDWVESVLKHKIRIMKKWPHISHEAFKFLGNGDLNYFLDYPKYMKDHIKLQTKLKHKSNVRFLKKYVDDENILFMNICDEGHGWKELCPFLNLSIPDIKFPRENVSYTYLFEKYKLYDILEKNNIDIEVLKKNNVYLMGGSILRLFMNLPLNTDLDFYFVDDKSFKNVDDYFRKNFKFLHKTPLFINYEVNNLTVSLVYDKKLLGTYENLNKSYSDFTISAGCFDFGTETFKYPETYFEDIENKRLIPNSDLNNQFPANLLKRINKFKVMGFTVDGELVDEIKKRPIVIDKFQQRVIRKSWLRNEDVYPIVPNIDVFVNWLMDIKDHSNLKKFNAYLWGGFISHPHKTKDIDVLLTKRDGQRATLRELEELMVDMFDSAYDTHGFFLDTCYMRTPQWIADYPRDREVLKAVERKQLFITITKHTPEYMVRFKRYGKLNCCHMGTWEKYWKDKDIESEMAHRWVDLDANYARMVDLRRIIKYYENDKKRNIEDFKEKFQEYSGY